MSKRFAIRSTRPAEQKEGNKIIGGTGESIPFRHGCELGMKRSGENEFEYVTGLEPNNIKYSIFFDHKDYDELKKSLLKQQAEDVKLLGQVYGKDTIRSNNKYFWDEYSQLVINNETLSMFFDTSEPIQLLLYWKIMGGGYADEIGPTYETALSLGLPFYMTEIEEEAERRGEDVSSKVKAFALLEEISQKKSNEDLLWLAWMLHPSNQGFTKITPAATLFQAHYEFIEGKLVKKAKKACSKQFVDACNLLKNNKTEAIATAIVKAGDYFGLIYTSKEGKLVTRKNGLILGETVDEAIDTLLKPTNQEELEVLREEVEEKLK